MKHMLSHVLKKSFPLSHLKNIRVVATWAARYHQIGPGWSAIDFFFKNDTFTNQIYKKRSIFKIYKNSIMPVERVASL
jgi:hypothetical protein